MAGGLEILSEDGAVLFGTETRAFIILGVVNTGINNGSVTNALLSSGGAKQAFAMPISNYYEEPPKVTISGNTVSWAFNVSGYINNSPHRIIYGIW